MTDSRIPTVRLGDGGPEVGVQGLGCMGMSFAYGPSDAGQSRATLERALELGVTLYDTADVYGLGENERFLAPFLRAHRDEVVLATKFALSLDHVDPTKRTIRNDPPYVRQCAEASLGRLGTDVIDLYYMHRRDVNVPIEETVGAMAELVREGKVKHLGLSEVTAAELRAAHAVHPRPLLGPGQGDLAEGGAVGVGDRADRVEQGRVGRRVVAGEAGLLTAEVVVGEPVGAGDGAGEEAPAQR